MPRVPRSLPGCDIRKLPLSPTEAFLLSRIDATVSERELSLITGLPLTSVAAALERLYELGAIGFTEEQSPLHRTERPPAPGASPLLPPAEPGRSAASAPAKPPLSSRPPPGNPSGKTPPLYDPAELDEDVEIEPERRRRVLDLFYKLEELTYYQLLGLSEQADKKQIKGAYYALAPEFHPDKYFRKRLGSYKIKIEAIFNRITQAHDTLTSKPRRAEYDAYLEQAHRNRAMEALLDQTPRDVARVSAAVDESAAALAGAEPSLREGALPGAAVGVPLPSSLGRYSSEAAPRFVDPASGLQPLAPPASSPRLSHVPPSHVPPSDVPPVSDRPPESPRSRRATLARKLAGHGILRRNASPPTYPAAPDPIAAQRAAEALRARYEAALAESRRVQLQRYLDLGRGALDRQDYAGAANAYRIAASLAPEDRDVQATCDEVMRHAATALAEGYRKQAQYEENQGRWAEAALSYSRTCAGRPGDARAHERVAFTTLKSSANTRRAVEFARKAVELEPNIAEFRLTLALAYAAAGFEKSARGEIERAQELSPNDAKIRELGAAVREQTQRNGKPG
jgi:curved DNA-binding protein CbpA